MKQKKGFGIPEAVIAMAVITLVSIAAITTIKRAITFANETAICNQARTDAENALELFKYAPDGKTFDALLPFSNLSPDSRLDPNTEDKDYVYEYGILYKLIIHVHYGQPGPEDDFFSARCVDTAMHAVFSFDYKKG